MASDYQFLTNRFGERFLYELNRNTFQTISATETFKRYFKKDFHQTDTLYIILGTDSGLLPRYIVSETIPEATRYIFIEPREFLPVIEKELADLDMTVCQETESDNSSDSGETKSTLPMISLIPPDLLDDYLKNINIEDYIYLDRFQFRESLASLDSYHLGYRQIYTELRTLINDQTWQTQRDLGGQPFIREQIKNLGVNRIPAITLQNSFKGKTAILLGGGPSLDDTIPWLKQNHQRIIIIAVSRIARRLLDVDITPHIVVSIDPHQLSFDVSKEMLRLPEETLFVNLYHANMKLASQWHGKQVYIGPLFPWKSKQEKENIQGVGGPTVSNIAINLAFEMGFKQLILTGMDLCYSANGNSHAKGSNEFASGPQIGMMGMPVKTYAGRMAETPPDFFTAIKALTYQARTAKDFDCKMINVSCNAVAIDGITYQPIEEIDIPPLDEEIFHCIGRHLPENNRTSRIAHYKMIQKELAHINGRLRSIKKLAKEALDCNDGLFGRNGKTADFKYKKRMDKIERRLDREYKDISPIVRRFGAADFLRLPPRDREWTDEEIENAGITYYTAYINSSEFLLKLIDQAQQRIQSCIHEETPPLPLDKLYKQWMADDTPGRYRVVLNHNLGLKDTFSDHDKNILSSLEDAFTEQIENTDTSHRKLCQERMQAAPVRSKLLLMLRQNNIEGLGSIIKGLSTPVDNQQEELLLLAQGYLLELQQQDQMALEKYTSLVNRIAENIGETPDKQEKNPRLEDGLRRMSYITLKQEDYDNALLVMDALAAISPVYEPQYAELLRLTGNKQQAIDVYSNYLQKIPNDYGSMIKLGKLYAELQIPEAARVAYEHVLNAEPDNETARILLQDLQEISH